LDIIHESDQIRFGRRTTASQAPPSRHFNTTLTDKQSRNICSATQVVSADGCGSLAARCGISGAAFESYNLLPALCWTLQIGQHVCCLPGDLPDFRPQPNPDRTCETYTVQAGEWCALIASDHLITADDIENFNKPTWGWNGCQFMQVGQPICLNTGNPPDAGPRVQRYLWAPGPGDAAAELLLTVGPSQPLPAQLVLQYLSVRHYAVHLHHLITSPRRVAPGLHLRGLRAQIFLIRGICDHDYPPRCNYMSASASIRPPTLEWALHEHSPAFDTTGLSVYLRIPTLN
jgi:hypothetical protein